MGDVAMTVPVLKELAKQYPELRIIMLTRDFYEPFFEGIPNLVVHNIDLAETHNGVKGVYVLFKELTEQYKIDFIVDLNDKLYSKLLRHFFTHKHIKSTHIDKGRSDKKALTRKKNKVLHQLRTSIDRYADAFTMAGYPINIPDDYTFSPRPLPTLFADLKTNRIGLAPFAKHKGKVLPLQTIRAFIETMAREMPEYKIVIFGGGAAERMVADSLVAWYPNCVSAVSKVTLRDEINLMANLKLIVSMDSSAMHMASLVGVPVVSVWGATHPFAGFLGRGQSVDNVVIGNLPCQPCSVYGHKPCYRGDYACLRDVKAQEIFDKVKRLLSAN